jgi:endonuclease YncB( thermonuclease family)
LGRTASARADGGNRVLAGVVLLALACAAPVAISGVRSSEPAGDATAEPGEHEVAHVLDGDTIVLEDGRRVRLAQIDAPEVGENECFAQAARETLESILPQGTRISLRRDRKLDGTDRYGRLIRYVIAHRANVNVQLVRRGAASVWFVDGARGRRADALLRAARRARRARAGFWRTCPGTELDTSHGVETDATRTRRR